MASLNRLPPYVIVGCLLFMISFYYVVNLRQKNSDLQKNVNIFKESLTISKEKNKVLVKDALEKIDKKDARVKKLEEENLSMFTKLGKTQAKLAELTSQLELKKDEIKKLHKLAEEYQTEISTLTKSVSESKGVLAKLSGKAEHLMSDHKKLKKENAKLQQQNEKLESDLKQQESERSALDRQLSALKTEKQDLAIKVDDMNRKNEAIQESIKQKIKESYANHRLMSQKEITDKQAKQRTTTQRPSQIKQTDSKEPDNLRKQPDENQEPKVTVDNPNNPSKAVINDPKSGNVSRIMVDNSNVLVNNEEKRDAGTDNKNENVADENLGEESRSEENRNINEKHESEGKNNEEFDQLRNGVENREGREKRDAITDNKDESVAGENVGEESRGEENRNINKESDSEGKDNEEFDQLRNRMDDRKGREKRDAITDNKDEGVADENLGEESRSEENENIDEETLSEVNGQENVNQLRNRMDTLPEFPKIQEETINVQPQVYGDHEQDGKRPDEMVK